MAAHRALALLAAVSLAAPLVLGQDFRMPKVDLDYDKDVAQFVGGSLSNQYNWGGGSSVGGLSLHPGMSDQTLLIQGTNTSVPVYNAFTGVWARSA